MNYSATFTDDLDTFELIAQTLQEGAEQRRAVGLKASSQLEAERRTGLDIRRGATRVIHVLAEADTLERYAKAIRAQLATPPMPAPAPDPNAPPLPLEPPTIAADPAPADRTVIVDDPAAAAAVLAQVAAQTAAPGAWVPQLAADGPDADEDPGLDTGDDEEPGFVLDFAAGDLDDEPASAALRR